MAQTYGPKYPGIQDGLVFSFDPKNRDCWKGGLTNVNNIVRGTSGSMSGLGASGVDGAITSEGYIHWDGTDSYAAMEDTNTSLGLVGTNQMSATFWANSDGSQSSWATPFGATNSNAFTDGWAFYNLSNKLYFFVEHYTSYDVVADANIPTAGTWFSVTGVYDGTLGSANVKMYVNGVQQSSTANFTGNITQDSTNGVFLGRPTGYAGYYWDGKAGPCMIWNRPLSAGEVLTNYNRLKGRFGL